MGGITEACVAFFVAPYCTNSFKELVDILFEVMLAPLVLSIPR